MCRRMRMRVTLCSFPPRLTATGSRPVRASSPGRFHFFALFRRATLGIKIRRALTSINFAFLRSSNIRDRCAAVICNREASTCFGTGSTISALSAAEFLRATSSSSQHTTRSRAGIKVAAVSIIATRNRLDPSVRTFAANNRSRCKQSRNVAVGMCASVVGSTAEAVFTWGVPRINALSPNQLPGSISASTRSSEFARDKLSLTRPVMTIYKPFEGSPALYMTPRRGNSTIFAAAAKHRAVRGSVSSSSESSCSMLTLLLARPATRVIVRGIGFPLRPALGRPSNHSPI